MERSSDGDVHRINILEAEDFADQLALELLAPHHAVVHHLESQGIIWESGKADDLCYRSLVHDYGLPWDVAKKYGNILILARRKPRSFREWLGIPAS